MASISNDSLTLTCCGAVKVTPPVKIEPFSKSTPGVYASVTSVLSDLDAGRSEIFDFWQEIITNDAVNTPAIRVRVSVVFIQLGFLKFKKRIVSVVVRKETGS